jgi:hypothetical protein
VTEYHVGQRVRFVAGAEVSYKFIGRTANVEGYAEVDETDYVIVTVDGVEQWVLPREIVPAKEVR